MSLDWCFLQSSAPKGPSIGSSSIGNLVNLEALVLSENQLSGTIPPSITAIKRLQYLHLDQNRLQGTIPTFLGNLTLLVELSLSSNELQGTVPLSLGDCQHMNLLYVDDNSLTGVVPQQIVDITTLVYIDLSNNHLNGAFPSELGNLKTLSELYISSNNFSGMIPSTIGSCTSLEMLYMSHNSLSGRIPSTLSNLKSIRELDLSLNNFSGRIPKYLESLNLLVRLNLSFNNFDGDVPTKGIFNNRTGISLTGNRKLCGGPTEMHLPPCPARNLKKSKISFLKVIIPVIASCSIFSFVIIIITLTRRRFVRNRSTLSPTEEQFPMVTYAELRSATDNFSSSNKIGQGSFGHVYKGVLGEIRKLVAVKVIDLRQRKGLKSFIAECEALRHIRHRNLIKIVTICSSVDAKGDEFKALIYEYMENGNLEEWLHQDHKDGLETRNLSFIERLNIAIDVASALEYLHHHCDPPIVHGDLKATNVLLDCDMVANVGDFGLSKFLSKGTLHPTHQAESSSLGIRGTIGYVAPEYGIGNEISTLGDVYSYGILLLEILTGKRPTDSMFYDGLNLHEFSKLALPERVMEIVEHTMVLDIITSINDENFERLYRERKDRNEECLRDAVRIGVVCSMESPAERMKMTDVVAKLHSIREKLMLNLNDV